VNLSTINTDRQQLSLAGNTLSLENGGAVDLSPFLNENTDMQRLTLDGTILSLERGGAVNLSTINTDGQQLSLLGNTLTLENGGTVDLSPFLNEDSDKQQLTLNGAILSLERGGDVNLSTINTDNQQLNLNGSVLSLTNGGTVNMDSFLIDSDEQELAISSINSETISVQIENANTLYFRSGDNVVLSVTDSETILIDGVSGSFSTENNITSNVNGAIAEDDFVFGSSQLNNDSNTTSDNKRFFYDKSKGAFRAGFAQSNQWDEENIGTYSIAMGRNTVASGYHATAFGSATLSDAWYSTAMGNGTEAVSHSEVAIGRFNSKYTPLGSTNGWELTDRLFVIGNGTGDSASERSDALVMLKNGDTTVFGNWSGPAFTNISDRRFKDTIEPLEMGLETLSKINPKQYFLKNDPLNITHFGIVADELQTVIPNLVYTNEQNDNLLSINYVELIPVLINAVNELSQKVDAQNKKIKALQTEIKIPKKIKK